MKLYDPAKCNSFQMMFGFDQPVPKINRNENKRKSKTIIARQTSPAR